MEVGLSHGGQRVQDLETLAGCSPHVHCLFGGRLSLTSGSEHLGGRGQWVPEMQGSPFLQGKSETHVSLGAVGSFLYL